MCSLVWCAPLALFPAKFHEEKKNNQDTIDENKKDSENVPSIKGTYTLSNLEVIYFVIKKI